MVSKKDRDLENGDIFVGIVSHVIDSHTFYAATLEELEHLNAATNKLDEKLLQKMFWIPGVGEYILVNIQNDGIMRATRNANSSKDELCLYLIDTGEEFTCLIKDLNENLFMMPDFLTEIPPIAFQCTLNFKNDENNDVKICLEDSLYKKFTFEVVKTETNCPIQVNMWAYDDDEISEELAFEYEEEIDSLDMLQLREVLEKEDPVIFDAQVAVQGFHTKDDDRRCKFYDSRTGGCWKGGRCKEKHIPEIDDGTCRDTKAIHIYHENFSTPRPKRKTFYSIKIISFIDLNRFTCHYYDDEFYDGKKLNNLRKEINSGAYKLLKDLPAVDELVTVKIKENFYRARVLDKIDVHWTLPVFLVDEGTYIPDFPYQNLYEYCQNLRNYPFFAVEMEIADIKSKETNPSDNEAQKWIFATQQNSAPLRVLVVDNFPDITCKLYDSKYCEVGKMLIEKGLVEPKKIQPPSDIQPVQNYFIPG